MRQIRNGYASEVGRNKNYNSSTKFLFHVQRKFTYAPQKGDVPQGRLAGLLLTHPFNHISRNIPLIFRDATTAWVNTVTSFDRCGVNGFGSPHKRNPFNDHAIKGAQNGEKLQTKSHLLFLPPESSLRIVIYVSTCIAKCLLLLSTSSSLANHFLPAIPG